MRFFNTNRRNHRSARRDPDRVAGGYKAALSNPNTTHAGRKRAKAELHSMGRSAHVPFMTKVKRALGIHQTSRRQRESASRRERMDRRYGTGYQGRKRHGRVY
ncbi:hypothetical protein C8R43DRAFT_1022826 [Mycena crocata]|nr:hypothetical protein C8R43DRAFT_1022826 [Mycena crocata]